MTKGNQLLRFGIEQLFFRLYFQIYPDQIVLSHSPLRKLDILHDKHVVVSGQGPVAEIAAEYPSI